MLSKTGLVAVKFPLLAIESLPLTDNIIEWLDTLPHIDWLIFISANAVNFAQQWNCSKLVSLCRTARVAAVGQATADALQVHAIEVNLLPLAGFNSEALLATAEMQAVRGKRFLCIRGQGGRELLAETLRDRGAIVEYLEVYRRKPAQRVPADVLNLIIARDLDCIALTSGEAISTLLAIINQKIYLQLLLEIPVVVISERLRSMALDSGFKRVAISENPSDAAVVNTIISLVGGENGG